MKKRPWVRRRALKPPPKMVVVHMSTIYGTVQMHMPKRVFMTPQGQEFIRDMAPTHALNYAIRNKLPNIQ